MKRRYIEFDLLHPWQMRSSFQLELPGDMDMQKHLALLFKTDSKSQLDFGFTFLRRQVDQTAFVANPLSYKRLLDRWKAQTFCIDFVVYNL